MKVLHVIDSLNVGGAEKVFLDITKLLANNGLEIGALLFYKNSPLQNQLDEKLKVHVLNRKNKYSIQKMYEANVICSQYDIVHVHMRYCYSYIRLSQLLFNGKYKLVCHDHFGDIEFDSSVPFGLKYFFKPDYFIGVSKSLTNWAIDKVKIKQDNVFLLRNTITPDYTIKYQWKSSNQNAILVSNIRETKNIEFAIDLSNQLNMNLTVYGNNGDDVYYSKISDLIKNNTKIQIVSGVTDFSGLYNLYDIAIHCAKSESGPLVILEYLAYGVPFISYKTGEVAHTIYNELPMHFTESFAIDEWKQKMIEIKKQNDQSEKLKNIFNKYFSPEKYREECIKIYERIYC